MLHRYVPLIVVAGVLAAAAMTPHRRALAEDIPVQITVGDTATLQLDGNPSAGYRWVLNEPPPAGIVTVDMLGYATPELKPGERPLLGAPQKFQVLLTARDEGRAYLVFDYVKAGEASPAKTQAYKIEVLADASVTDNFSGDGSPRSMSRDLFQDPDDEQDGGGNDN